MSHCLHSQLEREIPFETLSRMKPDHRADFLAVYGAHHTLGQMIAYQLIAQAARRKIAAVSLLLDRVEGKVNQKTSVEGSSDLVLRVIRADL